MEQWQHTVSVIGCCYGSFFLVKSWSSANFRCKFRALPVGLQHVKLVSVEKIKKKFLSKRFFLPFVSDLQAIFCSLKYWPIKIQYPLIWASLDWQSLMMTKGSLVNLHLHLWFDNFLSMKKKVRIWQKKGADLTMRRYFPLVFKI